jgi:hypothetical protein
MSMMALLGCNTAWTCKYAPTFWNPQFLYCFLRDFFNKCSTDAFKPAQVSAHVHGFPDRSISLIEPV